MIDKQSDNVENLEENVSEEVNKNEDSSEIENQTSEDKQSLNVAVSYTHLTLPTNREV